MCAVCFLKTYSSCEKAELSLILWSQHINNNHFRRQLQITTSELLCQLSLMAYSAQYCCHTDLRFALHCLYSIFQSALTKYLAFRNIGSCITLRHISLLYSHPDLSSSKSSRPLDELDCINGN